jgi:hypothetical protein
VITCNYRSKLNLIVLKYKDHLHCLYELLLVWTCMSIICFCHWTIQRNETNKKACVKQNIKLEMLIFSTIKSPRITVTRQNFTVLSFQQYICSLFVYQQAEELTRKILKFCDNVICFSIYIVIIYMIMYIISVLSLRNISVILK